MEKPWYRIHREAGIRPEFEVIPRVLPDLLAETVKNHPGRTAAIFYGRSLSYAELYDRVLRFSQGLIKLGVKKGDRVALMLPNSPQFIISYFAILKAGAVVANTNPIYVAREILHQVSDAGAETIIATTEARERIESIFGDSPLKRIILTGFDQEKPKLDGHTHWMDDLIGGCEAVDPLVEISPYDVAVLQYTGGTTGVSKGATLTHFNLVANSDQVLEADYKPVLKDIAHPVNIVTLPLFHVYGMTCSMNAPIRVGGTMILIMRFDPTDVLEAIKTYGPTHFHGVPTMYIALLNHPRINEYDLTRCRVYISGGGPLPREIEESFDKRVAGSSSRLVQGYGLSESSPVTHCNPLAGPKKVGSIGPPYPNTLCKIVDIDTGTRELAPGEVGELIIKGPQVMKGYWNKPRETEIALRDGWLYTGDLGCMDGDGYFYIVDRKKDMVIASGYNIYPTEVEQIIYELPQVMEAVVAGVADRYRGETLKAYVVLKEGAVISEGEIISYCKQRLAPYKVPKLVEFRKELPKTAAGKFLRRMLVDEERKKAGI